MSIYIPPDGAPQVTPSDMDRRAAVWLRRRAAKAAVRAELDRARAHGLERRHTQKLRRNRAGDTTSKETA